MNLTSRGVDHPELGEAHLGNPPLAPGRGWSPAWPGEGSPVSVELVGDDGRVVARQSSRQHRDGPDRDVVADIGPVAGSRSSRGPPSCLATSRWASGGLERPLRQAEGVAADRRRHRRRRVVAAPSVTNSGVKCSTVGWAYGMPGAGVRKAPAPRRRRASASAAQASNSEDQPGRVQVLPVDVRQAVGHVARADDEHALLPQRPQPLAEASSRVLSCVGMLTLQHRDVGRRVHTFSGTHAPWSRPRRRCSCTVSPSAARRRPGGRARRRGVSYRIR